MPSDPRRATGFDLLSEELERTFWEARCRAEGRVDTLLPGILEASGAQEPGTNRLAVRHQAPVPVAALTRALGSYLGRADLSTERGKVVDPETGRAAQLDSPLVTAPLHLSRPSRLANHHARAALADGQTIVLNDCHDSLGPWAVRLCVDLATIYSAFVQGNVYISKGDSPGFGSHWDDHDVLVLQLDGRKYWEVYGPAEFSPLRPETLGSASGDFVWSGVLEPGAAMYIPRGWPHRVSGFSDVGSTHLTLSIRRPTAIDLLDLMPAEVCGAGPTSDDWTQAMTIWRSSLTISLQRPVDLNRHLVDTSASPSTFGLSLPGGLIAEATSEARMRFRVNGAWFEASEAGVQILEEMVRRDSFTLDDIRQTGCPDNALVDVVDSLDRVGVFYVATGAGVG